MSKRQQAGDTIVEVLIAVAIVATVIGGAYVATNRATKAMRAAQERSEAVKVAEAQIDRLKFVGTTNLPLVGVDIFAVGRTFCLMQVDDLLVGGLPDTDPTTTELIDPDVTSVSNDPICRFNQRYIASVTRDAATGVFEVRVLWENASSSNGVSGLPGFDEIKMYYRVHPVVP